MSLTFKAFLYNQTWRGDPVEIRRFTIDQDVSSSYAYLLEKVVQVFPSLTTSNAVLAWTDSDGDIVTISSDEELVEALDQFEGSVFRLYIKKRAPPSVTFQTPCTSAPQPDQTGQQGDAGTQDPPPNGPNDPPPQHTQGGGEGGSFHPGVMCDGCNGPIYGTRFKCLVCRDYDLCSGCEGKGIHVDHNMVSIVDPWSYHPWGGFGGGGAGYPPWAGFLGGFGPRRGGRGRRGGCCRGGGGGGGRFGAYPFHRGGDLPPWCKGAGAAPQQQGKTCDAEGQEPMDTEQRPGPSASEDEQRRTFVRGIGEAVSSFLEPFGVKVDVDVAGDKSGKEPESTTEAEAQSQSATNAQDSAEVSEEVVEEALAQLRSMGYQDEGGWLKELVVAKGGDVTKVLDALHPSVEQA